LYSEYLKYYPNRRDIQITEKFKVRGEGKQGEDQDIKFRSLGFRYDMEKNQVTLPQNVFFTMIRYREDIKTKKTTPETTLIQSDYSLIERNKKIAHFYMEKSRPADKRY